MASSAPCSPTRYKAPAAAGLPVLELSVVDGGPGRHLSNTAGFAVLTRGLTIPLPGTDPA